MQSSKRSSPSWATASKARSAASWAEVAGLKEAGQALPLPPPLLPQPTRGSGLTQLRFPLLSLSLADKWTLRLALIHPSFGEMNNARWQLQKC